MEQSTWSLDEAAAAEAGTSKRAKGRENCRLYHRRYHFTFTLRD